MLGFIDLLPPLAPGLAGRETAVTVGQREQPGPPDLRPPGSEPPARRARGSGPTARSGPCRPGPPPPPARAALVVTQQRPGRAGRSPSFRPPGTAGRPRLVPAGEEGALSVSVAAERLGVSFSAHPDGAHLILGLVTGSNFAIKRRQIHFFYKPCAISHYFFLPRNMFEILKRIPRNRAFGECGPPWGQLSILAFGPL